MLFNLPKDVNYILDKLEATGFKSYIVGGCVRDLLLSLEPHDYDITTDATPEQIKEVFSKTNLIIPTGEKYGTMTVVVDNTTYEVTTFRADSNYTDGRRPDKVEFSKSIEEDLLRRDFTINAIAYSQTEGLIDVNCSQTDLANKVIRAVGNPRERFNEDGLRIMRAIRFAARFDFEIAKETEQAIYECKHNLDNVSKERIQSELMQILPKLTSKTVKYLSNVIEVFIPELLFCKNFNQQNKYHCFDVFEHTMQSVVRAEKDADVRLALLFHDIAKPRTAVKGEDGQLHFYSHASVSAEIARKVLQRLRFDTKTVDKVFTLIVNHDVVLSETKQSVKRFMNKIGDLFDNFIAMRIADISAQTSLYYEERRRKISNIVAIRDEVLKAKECFSTKDLAIDGNDILRLGVKTSPQVGMLLSDCLAKVLEDGTLNTKEQLLAIVAQKL